MPYTIEAAQDGCYPGTTVLVNKFDLHIGFHCGRSGRVDDRNDLCGAGNQSAAATGV